MVAKPSSPGFPGRVLPSPTHIESASPGWACSPPAGVSKIESARAALQFLAVAAQSEARSLNARENPHPGMRCPRHDPAHLDRAYSTGVLMHTRQRAYPASTRAGGSKLHRPPPARRWTTEVTERSAVHSPPQTPEPDAKRQRTSSAPSEEPVVLRTASPAPLSPQEDNSAHHAHDRHQRVLQRLQHMVSQRIEAKRYAA